MNVTIQAIHQHPGKYQAVVRSKLLLIYRKLSGHKSLSSTNDMCPINIVFQILSQYFDKKPHS